MTKTGAVFTRLLGSGGFQQLGGYCRLPSQRTISRVSREEGKSLLLVIQGHCWMSVSCDCGSVAQYSMLPFQGNPGAWLEGHLWLPPS